MKRYGEGLLDLAVGGVADVFIFFGTADVSYNMATGISELGRYVPDAMFIVGGAAVLGLVSWSYLESKKP